MAFWQLVAWHHHTNTLVEVAATFVEVTKLPGVGLALWAGVLAVFVLTSFRSLSLPPSLLFSCFVRSVRRSHSTCSCLPWRVSSLVCWELPVSLTLESFNKYDVILQSFNKYIHMMSSLSTSICTTVWCHSLSTSMLSYYSLSTSIYIWCLVFQQVYTYDVVVFQQVYTYDVVVF